MKTSYTTVVRGRLPGRLSDFLFYTTVEEDGLIRVRIDDSRCLEFWMEVILSPVEEKEDRDVRTCS